MTREAVLCVGGGGECLHVVVPCILCTSPYITAPHAHPPGRAR